MFVCVCVFFSAFLFFLFFLPPLLLPFALFLFPQPFGHGPSGNGRDFIFHEWQVAVIESDRDALGIDYRPGRVYTIYP